MLLDFIHGSPGTLLFNQDLNNDIFSRLSYYISTFTSKQDMIMKNPIEKTILTTGNTVRVWSTPLQEILNAAHGMRKLEIVQIATF